MRVSRNKRGDVRFLCSQMVKRLLKNTPEREPKAAEIREDLIRLYAEISMLQEG